MMREIAKLSAEMLDELCGAMDYAKKYQFYKTSEQSIASKYQQMANDEIQHAEALHDIAVAKIQAAKDNGVTVPDYMREIWEEKHGEYIDKMTAVKMALSL